MLVSSMSNDASIPRARLIEYVQSKVGAKSDLSLKEVGRICRISESHARTLLGKEYLQGDRPTSHANKRRKRRCVPVAAVVTFLQGQSKRYLSFVLGDRLQLTVDPSSSIE